MSIANRRDDKTKTFDQIRWAVDDSVGQSLNLLEIILYNAYADDELLDAKQILSQAMFDHAILLRNTDKKLQ